jgi:hypothetical protein
MIIGSTTGGELLIASATFALAGITLVLALVGIQQLRALRSESRGQRTYDLYTRYFSESFLAPRLAAKAALTRAERLGIGLWPAYAGLTKEERYQLDRYVNFLEESSQQYLAGLLDRAVAEEGLAYIAWSHWRIWRDFVYAQRREQNTNRVCENWEYLHHELDDLYSPPPKQAAEALASSWLAALKCRSRIRGRRRLGKLVSQRSYFRLGPAWTAMRRRDALKQIRPHQDRLRRFAQGSALPEAFSEASEFVTCSTSERVGLADSCTQAAVIAVGTVWRERRWRARTVKHVVAGFAWYATREEALAAINASGDPASPERHVAWRRYRSAIAVKLRSLAYRVSPGPAAE